MPEDVWTILVVDDDRDVLETVSAIVEMEGYRVVEAASGDEALKVVRERPDVDLVLSDIRMPKMDGVEALGRMKELRPDLPVILMTAYALQDLEEKAFQDGVYTIVRKPFDMNAVLALIARALRSPAVLVIDANDRERAEALEVFRTHGHRAVAVDDVGHAIDVLHTQAVDVVVLELPLPEDGLRALRELRGAEPLLPILVVARDVPQEIRERAADLRIAAWARRPLLGTQLVRLVAELRGKVN